MSSLELNFLVLFQYLEDRPGRFVDVNGEVVGDHQGTVLKCVHCAIGSKTVITIIR